MCEPGDWNEVWTFFNTTFPGNSWKYTFCNKDLSQIAQFLLEGECLMQHKVIKAFHLTDLLAGESMNSNVCLSVFAPLLPGVPKVSTSSKIGNQSLKKNHNIYIFKALFLRLFKG